jgi:ATP-dependent DNA ligase
MWAFDLIEFNGDDLRRDPSWRRERAAITVISLTDQNEVRKSLH